MNFAQIAKKAEELRLQQLSVMDPSMQNYRSVLKEYKQIINDCLVLVREMAENLTPADNHPETHD